MSIPPFLRKKTVPTKRFIKACTPVESGSKAPPRYMYTMQSLDKPELSPLRETLPDLAFLSIHDYRLGASHPAAVDTCDSTGAPEGCRGQSSGNGADAVAANVTGPPEWWAANLWMGGRGTRAQPHFDQAHNVFVQLRGEKTVWLAPPEYLPDFYPYPILHPAGRQSRVSCVEVHCQQLLSLLAPR